jgi:N-acetylmuramoyl-L-alanine amidase
MNFPSLAPRAFSLLLAPWLLSAVLKAEEAFQWTPVEIGGRGYLSTEEIARFYKLTLRPREGLQVVFDTPKVLMKMEVGSAECTMNGMKFILETPVVESDAVAFVSRTDLAGVLDPVLRPGMIKNAGDFTTVIFDPVGGGEDPAAAGERGTVSDPSLEVALHAAKDLESRGIQVVLTRENGAGLTVGERLERVNAVDGKAVFIRIDLNSGAGDERGLLTAPLKSPALLPPDGESYSPASMALATGVHGSVMSSLRKFGVGRAIKSVDDPELRKIPHPVVIFTSGSLKNPYDARLMADEGYRKALAKGIVMGVLKYRGVTSK